MNYRIKNEIKPIRKIINIDMDCFYAAIEKRDIPELADKPIAVGVEDNRRVIIATSNYAALAFGVRSAMPTAQASKLCRHLILRTVRMEIYRKKSQYIRGLFEEYT
ncbi:hypothetical protein LEPN103867_14490 [Legionella pneumophila subsp. pneumophila]|nr:DNA damage inducible protein P [Legionella pneumophila]